MQVVMGFGELLACHYVECEGPNQNGTVEKKETLQYRLSLISSAQRSRNTSIPHVKLRPGRAADKIRDEQKTNEVIPDGRDGRISRALSRTDE